jgi:hypothetical protein
MGDMGQRPLGQHLNPVGASGGMGAGFVGKLGGDGWVPKISETRRFTATTRLIAFPMMVHRSRFHPRISQQRARA